jgi:hypothetical protein
MVGMNYNYSCSIISTAGRVFNPNEGSGKFTFSSLTCKYVNGTDNETGYNSPSVWFYINASSSNGKTISLLDTNMTVISSNYSYKTGKGQSPLATIYVKGTGSCQRVFSHQTFSATYSWQAYFDKSTGFIVSYGYFQNDTNSNGNSFSCSNKLIVSSSSYGVHLVPQTAPTPKTTFPFTDVIFSIIAIFIVAILIVLLVSRHGRNNKLSKHSNTRPGVTSNMNNDNTADGKPLDFKPESGGTEQIVIKEIVKVKCEYCGALIDSTAKKCPFCGAPRN